ncbi:MAG: hypothetical protein KKC21_00545, partial [Nitrospinae bacterium]|nr:hypothetical protein [Nitrospinota bacterium]
MKPLFTKLILPLLILITFSQPLYAIDEVDKGGSFRLIGQYAQNPSDTPTYPNGSDYRGDIVARQFLTAGIGESVWFDINLHETFSYLKSESPLSPLYSGVERSSALESNLFDDKYSKGEIALDRLNMRLSFERVDLTAGRQPINLATTFHFTPNDFFAPFSASTFYRVYKEGVDAVRGEVRINDLTQLSLIAVLGYEEDSSSSTGWSSSMDEGRNSYLARISTSLANFEWSILGGKVRREKVVGG